MIKVHYEYEFWFKKMPLEFKKEGTFGGTYLVDIYSGISGQWYNGITFKKAWKEIDQIIMMLVLM